MECNSLTGNDYRRGGTFLHPLHLLVSDYSATPCTLDIKLMIKKAFLSKRQIKISLKKGNSCLNELDETRVKLTECLFFFLTRSNGHNLLNSLLDRKRMSFQNRAIFFFLRTFVSRNLRRHLTGPSSAPPIYS